MFRTNSLRSILFAFFLILSCLSSLSAQQRFSFGPRVGLNLSNYWGNNDNMKYTPGLSAGVFLMYSSLNHFGISGDVLFSQRGTSFDNGTRKFIQRVNYLEIPVVARYFLTLSGNFRPNLFIGPSLGIKLNAKQIKNQLAIGTTLPDVENANNFDSIDFGGTGGFQLNWGTGNRQHFLIDARYTLGLSPVQTNNGVPFVTPRNSLQNSTFTLALGYSFGVGREHPSRFRR